MLKKSKYSIIVINYNVGKELGKLIDSIYKYNSKSKFEIIVIDNSETDSFKKESRSLFNKKIRYFKTKKNIGYGAAINYGVSLSKGEHIIVLNPDTKLNNGSLDILINFLNNGNKVGIVSPIIKDEDNVIHELLGSLMLTPLRAIMSLSFISKIFPNNRYFKEYYQLPWNKKKKREVEVVPGTAFAMKKSLFEKVGGFDEKFFLYFEEFDFCKRVVDLGYRNYIIPEVALTHSWGASTKQLENRNKYFEESRFYYFKKHFGLLGALVTESFLRVNKFTLLLFAALAVGFLLRIYELNNLMGYFQDMGVYYLSAKEMLVDGVIPLVGTATSHPWMYHGAHWTYVLAGILWLFNFNPVAPAYFIAILGTLTVALLYFIVRDMFGRKVAILSSILYATSPFLIMNSRIPYHTSPLPFFVLVLFYSVFRLIKGNKWMLPLITFLLAVLYNHEITTFVFAIIVGLILLYGIYKKRNWAKSLMDKKILFISTVTFLIPMIPFIVRDLTTGVPNQTFKFLAWVGYRVVKLPLSYIDPRFKSPGSSPSTATEAYSYFTDLVFSPSALIAFGVLVLMLIYTIYIVKTHIKRNKKLKLGYSFNLPTAHAILFLFLFLALAGLASHRFPIEADALLLAPFIIILFSLTLLWIFKNKFNVAFAVVVLIAVINTYALISTSYFTQSDIKPLLYKDKLEASNRVIELANDRQYNIVGKGALGGFDSFLTPYEYMLWWKGGPPSDNEEELKILIWEKEGEIVIKEISENEKY